MKLQIMSANTLLGHVVCYPSVVAALERQMSHFNISSMIIGKNNEFSANILSSS